MPAPVLYLTFRGNARQALEFYADVFGCDLVLHSYSDFGRTDGPPDAVAHGILTGPVDLFGADGGPDDRAVHIDGAMLALLGTAEPPTLHAWFDRLAEGGSVVDPLGPKPWGASDGQVVDRYGLHWLVGYEPVTDVQDQDAGG